MTTLTSFYDTAASLARDAQASREAARHWLAGRIAIPLEKCPLIERASNGAVACEHLRPDVDWLRDEDGLVTGYHVRVSSHPATIEKVA